MFSNNANLIFEDAISTYKLNNTVDQPFVNKYDKDSNLIEHLLYRKCWIDTFNGLMKILFVILLIPKRR